MYSNPIIIDGLLYFTTAKLDAVALDAVTEKGYGYLNLHILMRINKCSEDAAGVLPIGKERRQADFPLCK
jgi:hypothetical protein